MQLVHTSPETIGIEPKGLSTWLQILSHVDPRYGGIATSVPLLARATEAQSAHHCHVLAFCNPRELDSICPEDRPSFDTFSPSRLRSLFDLSARRRLRDVIQAADGIHIHGLWETHSMAVSGLALSSKKPYIVSAHGMLEPWALGHKQLKKAFYAAVIETRRMRGAACLRALSTGEVDDYRRLGLTNRIAIIPNGIETPPCGSPNEFFAMYPELNGKRIVLFLGRLHPKKGLPLLVEAWSEIMRTEKDLHLVIAGPDSEGTRARLEQMVIALNLQASVSFPGMITGPQKWNALAAASLFVLPSYSEGFSVAVLEALAMGIPTVVTGPCHIPEIAVHQCGWVVDPDVDSLEIALHEFLQLSAKDCAQLGDRGRMLVRQRFHVAAIGKQLAQVYDWLEGGSLPSSVEIV